MLKWILGCEGADWIYVFSLASFCDGGDESSASIRELINQLSSCQILKKDRLLYAFP